MKIKFPKMSEIQNRMNNLKIFKAVEGPGQNIKVELLPYMYTFFKVIIVNLKNLEYDSFI